MDNIFERKDSFKVFIITSLPLVFSLVVNIIYSMADTYFIAATQNTLLVAGVSVCAPLFTIFMAFGNIFAQGGCSLISRLLGRRDYEGVGHVTAFSFYISLATGVLIAILLLIFKTPLLTAMGADVSTLEYAEPYYICLSLGAPVIVLSFVPSNQLRAEGLPKEAMIGTILGAVINIILDPILISVAGLGALGAAIASVTGYLFNDLYYVWVILKKSKHYSIHPKMIRMPKRRVRECVTLGISNGINNVLQTLCQVVLNFNLLMYGNDKIAAMGIALKVNTISTLVMVGFAFGSQPILGYLVGSGQRERLTKLIKQIVLFLTGLSVVMEVIVLIFAPQLMSIFLKDPDVIQTGARMIRLLTITLIPAIIVIFMMILFLSMGKALQGFLLAASRQGYMFLIVFFILAKSFGYEGILWAQAVADVLSFVLAIVLIRIVMHRKKQINV